VIGSVYQVFATPVINKKTRTENEKWKVKKIKKIDKYNNKKRRRKMDGARGKKKQLNSQGPRL
jgi:hypothetical protein